MVLLQLKDPLGLFVKRKEFLSSFGFLYRHDMTQAAESYVNTTSSFIFRKSVALAGILVNA